MPEKLNGVQKILQHVIVDHGIVVHCFIFDLYMGHV